MRSSASQAQKASFSSRRGGRLLLFDKAHPDGKAILHKDEWRSAAFGYELNDFADAVLDGTPLEAGPEYSLGNCARPLPSIVRRRAAMGEGLGLSYYYQSFRK